MQPLYELVHYQADIEYLFNTHIREYDMRKANISCLFHLGLINQETYQKLYDAPRMDRQVFVGKMIGKNSLVGKKLADCIIQSKKALFERNKIQDWEVLSINNDAIYTIDKKLSTTKVASCIEFVLKNEYTSFLSLLNLKLLYSSTTGEITVKGISDDTVMIYHKKYMLDYIAFLFDLIESGRYRSAYERIRSFQQSYILGELPLGYYREFNNMSLFKSKYVIGGSTYYLDLDDSEHMEEAPESIDNLDIWHNYYVIDRFRVLCMNLELSRQRRLN